MNRPNAADFGQAADLQGVELRRGGQVWRVVGDELILVSSTREGDEARATADEIRATRSPHGNPYTEDPPDAA